MVNINEAVNIFSENSLITSNEVEFKALKSGTTNGVIYLLTVENTPTYVIKIDHPSIINSTKEFLLAYQDVQLLPNVHYIDDQQEFLVYSYISGETHFNRGLKLKWMTRLIKELFNQYQKVEQNIPWGRVNGQKRKSWSEFNQISFESAKANIGDLLSSEDHNRVASLVSALNEYQFREEKYYLHGDTGVHNFVYSDNELRGVIDPSPLIGPRIYDFTYAFCSSPDHLDFSTLLAVFSLWDGNDCFSNERLLGEVLFQLYTRIGVCIKVHPHDLNEYMDAWREWREYLPSI
jgi:aminoglycoside phosphotransferase